MSNTAKQLPINDPNQKHSDFPTAIKSRINARHGFRTQVANILDQASRNGQTEFEITVAKLGKGGFKVEATFVEELVTDLTGIGYAIKETTSSTGAENFKNLRITF